ncbi:hypothetical protein JCM11251_006341 [Rhodosporidiobolus azoricus]
MLLHSFFLIASILLVHAFHYPLHHASPFSAEHPHPPPIPTLNYLFTARFSIKPNQAPLVPGPKGIRLDMPIIGGTVKGMEGFEGEVLPVGSDWVLVDPLSGISTASARWQIVIRNNLGNKEGDASSSPAPQEVESEIFVRTSGPSLPGPAGMAKAHLRMTFETGSERWRWLNFIAPLGVLEILNPQNTTKQEVKIDVFNLEGEWTKLSYDKAVAGLMT